MAAPYERIVKQDLNLGKGTVEVTMPAGGTATGDKVGIHTLLPGVYNPRDYGANGDGSNDTVPITAAVADAYANHAPVVFPPGTYLCNGVVPHIADVTLLMLGAEITGTTASLANLNMIRFIDGKLEFGSGDSARARIWSGDRGIHIQTPLANQGTYVNAFPNGTPVGIGITLAKALFSTYGFFNSAADYETMDFEASKGTDELTYYYFAKTRKAGTGTHRPVLAQVGGHNSLMFDPSTGALITCGPDGEGTLPQNYLVGFGGDAGSILIGKNGQHIWFAKNGVAGAFRGIGSNGSDEVVLDQDGKGVRHGASGILIVTASGHIDPEAYTVDARVKDGTANYSPGDTSLNVTGGVTYAEITNTVSTTISALTNGSPGQIVTLYFPNDKTILGRTNFLLAGGVNFQSSAGAVIQLVKQRTGQLWSQLGPAQINNS